MPDVAIFLPPVGRAVIVLAAAAAGALPLAALAQAPPDAGSVIEQLRPRTTDPALRAPSVRIDTPADNKPAPDTPPFPVTGFRLTGATVFPEAELLPVLGPAGQDLRLSQLQERAARLTKFYNDRGYPVARALVPAQDVRDGVVEIRVVEGRYGRIDIRNATEISEARIRGLLGVSEGKLVHGPSLEKGVLLLTDLSGVEPKATLEPGEGPGLTDLVLEVGAGRTREFSATVDNAGSRFTGKRRLSLSGAWNSPADIGDRLSGTIVTSGELLLSMRLAYEAHLGTSGLRGGPYVSRTTYELGDTFRALEASGTADSVGASFALPLIRSSALNLRALGSLESRRLEDKVGAANSVTNKSAEVLQAGLAGDFRDGFLAGALTAIQGQLTSGRLSIDTPAVAALDAATLQTQGRYTKFAGSINRIQGLTDTLRLGIAYSFQRAGKNLDTSEKFSVGGFTGVRAYPAGEASGDEGQLLQLELRLQAGQIGPGQFSPFTFFDAARTRLVQNGFGGAPNRRRLTGYGIGAEWAVPGSLFVRGWLAFKGTSQGATSDTDSPSRLWLQAGVAF